MDEKKERGAVEAHRGGAGSPGIYIASKAKHGKRWQALRAEGVPIAASWIDESGPGETPSFGDLWIRNLDEATRAAAVIVYNEPGERMKGALVEIGAALAAGVPVLWVGPVADPEGELYTVSLYPLVRRCETLEQAIEAARPHLLPIEICDPCTAAEVVPWAFVLAGGKDVLVLRCSDDLSAFLDSGRVPVDASSQIDAPPAPGLWFWEGKFGTERLEAERTDEAVLRTKRWVLCSIRDVINGEAPEPPLSDALESGDGIPLPPA